MWKGSATTDDDTERLGRKPGSHPKLSLLEQFFLVLVSLLALESVESFLWSSLIGSLTANLKKNKPKVVYPTATEPLSCCCKLNLSL